MAFTFDQVADLAISAIVTPPSPSASGTTLGVTAGQGAWFPVAPFDLIAWPVGTTPTPVNAKRLRVTAVSGDTLTLNRSADGLNTARTLIVGDQVMAPLSSAAIVAMQTAINSNATAIASEITRATAAESTNATAIAAEITRATGVEALKAPLASPALTGVPTTPTAAPGTNTTQVASTAFVQAAVSGGGAGLPKNVRTVTTAPPSTANGDLFLADASGGTFTIPPIVSPSVGDLFTVIKTDASANAVAVSGTVDSDPTGASITAKDFGSVFEYVGATGWRTIAITSAGGVPTLDTNAADFQMNGVAAAGSTGKAADAGHVHPTDTSRAPLASPTFTGTPKAPTPTPGDNTTNIATTAFISTALAGVVSSSAAVDLCAAPYNCPPNTPGFDTGAQLQIAINAANTSNLDTTLFFSKPGTYYINSAQQSGNSGTTPNRAYNGQILFPARGFTGSGPITIRILAPVVPAVDIAERNTELNDHGGVQLLSNSTAGWIFDAIASSDTNNSTNPNTDIRVIFENMRITAPTDPQGTGGINGFQLASLRFHNCIVDSGSIGGNTLTGSGIGIQFPPFNNMGANGMTGFCEVSGWPTDIAHSEHFRCDDLYLKNANVGVVAQGQGGTGHASVYSRLLFGGVKTCIQAASSGIVLNGQIDLGDSAGGFTITNVIDDSLNLLGGEIRVVKWKESAQGSQGFPVNGGTNLRLVPASGRPTSYPADAFSRLPSTQVSSQNYIGATDKTHHVWRYVAGSATNFLLTTAPNGIKATSNASTYRAVVANDYGRVGASRVIHAVLTTGTSYNVSLVFGAVLSGAKNPNWAMAQLTGGQILLKKNIGGVSTTLASSAAAVVAATTQYTLDVVISNPVGNGGLYTVSVYLNGSATATVSYTMNSTDIADLAEGDPSLTADGIQFSTDGTSSIQSFAVQPL